MSVTGITILFYMQRCSYLTGNIRGSPRPVTGMALLYVDVRTSQETRVWVSAVCFGDSFTFLYVDDRAPQDTVYDPPCPVGNTLSV
jgi:hypothetical protein